MLDFLRIATRTKKQGHVEIYPKFIIKKSEDLMIRGSDFYAVWIEEIGMWSTDEQDVFRLIDNELEGQSTRYQQTHPDEKVRALYMWDAESGMVDSWHKYCQKQMRDNFHQLDETLIFASKDGRTKKNDYASKTLKYALEPGDYSAYEKLISTLYSEKERHKIEWVIGAIVSGDSKRIQKFMVLYGSAGTGKSTILNIVQMLFDGYWATFDAKAIGSSNGTFALEYLKNNPLVAIQHDGDLSRIEDNTRLNSLVSHEQMTVNEKHKSLYSMRFNCFLLMGTNKPVKITDAKSGLIRRLIDVSPSGNTLSTGEYDLVMNQIPFELGAIANHCLEVYKDNRSYYNTYIPTNMMGASNDFYNFVEDSYLLFKKEDGTTLKAAWEMYREYCDDAKVSYPFSKRVFKEELKNYFDSFNERYLVGDNTRVRNYYAGFKSDKFDTDEDQDKDEPILYSIDFKDHTEVMSNFNLVYRDCPAQYATDDGKPIKKWVSVKTTLKDLDTTTLHYVKPPENHIVIDFDITDETGEKSYELNLKEASKWPKTYAELSKSGAGIHLHYIYTGDPKQLMHMYKDQIEIKTFTGKSSLRRKLTKCNDLPIATISSGLPLKGEKMVNPNVIKSERGLRTLIMKNLNKQVHPATKPSIDFIFKILEDAYESGMKYDVSDMRNAILTFASQSTNQAEYCLKLIPKMKFKSEEPSDAVDSKGDIAFFDIEVFPNLVLVCWKIIGEGKPVYRMFNPSPAAIEAMLDHKLVGFNCRRYDNHIVYALLLGYSPERCYQISQKIISGDRGAFFGEAYNLSYTDIYDFASAGNKKSLKKLEIDMGIHHQELGLPWDQPVDSKLWDKVGDYCENDVLATEAAFNYLKADWTARQILADLAEMTVNDTTNTLTTKMIFGKNRKPQSDFCYRNMAEIVDTIDVDVLKFLRIACPDMIGDEVRSFISCAEEGKPVTSVLPYFPGYSFEGGESIYRGESVGEGGYVYAKEGIHTDVALLDVVSMHPHSLIAECLLGPKYTKIFRDLVEARVAIKHENWDVAEKMLDGKLVPYIEKVKAGEMTSKDLANALKTAINSVYGLTAASFDNPFRDIRNKDNIVAKRGALFMVDLKYEVLKRGFTVAHIKTDSIKIPGATPEIIDFVMQFGKKYGYEFEHEATYEKMCLVNDAVYIAKYASEEWCMSHYGYLPGDNKKKAGKWTATGTQFQVPYVFKTLFSHDPIEFDDMCETKSVTTALYLDMNEDLEQLTPEEEKELEILDKAWHSNDTENFVETDPLIINACKRYGYSFEEFGARYANLCRKDTAAHSYRFVGRVGQFCPVKDGCGGGYLVREKDGKYYAVGGTKDQQGKPYRWLESEMVKDMAWGDMIDKRYYNDLVDKAIDAISEYGDFEWFTE